MAAILPVTIMWFWFSTLILLPPFGGRHLPTKCAGSTILVSRKSRKAYSAALNNQKSCVVSLPEPLSPQRYHKPSPGRIGCEECCCHLTTSYLVGVRDYGGRHDRCSGRRHQGKHQSEENKELAHVSLTCHCFAALWRRRTDRSICVRSTNEDEIVEALDNVE